MNPLEFFYEATKDVLDQILDEAVKPCGIQKVDSPSEILEVAVILGLTGHQEGRVVFEFSQQTGLNIAKVMNFGEEFLELDHMARATLSELGNLIAGRAVTLINNAGGLLQISPPILMCGIGMRCSDMSAVHKMKFGTHVGDVFVNLSIRPSRRRKLGEHQNQACVAG
jgi:chemotaxis protein CheX